MSGDFFQTSPLFLERPHRILKRSLYTYHSIRLYTVYLSRLRLQGDLLYFSSLFLPGRSPYCGLEMLIPSLDMLIFGGETPESWISQMEAVAAFYIYLDASSIVPFAMLIRVSQAM